MKSGIMMKLILISIVCLLGINKVLSEEMVYFYTNASNCNTCYSFTLDAVRNYHKLFDSLKINYKIVLKCKRDRDRNYYREFHNLDSNLVILNSENLIENHKKIFKNQKREYMAYLKNDSLKYETSNLNDLIDYLKK